MGDLLPLPDELKPIPPVDGQGLKIEVSILSEYNDGKLKFQAISNIPDGTPIIFTLRGKKYTAQCKATTSNSTLISDWFSDKGNSIKDGFYTVELSCPIDKVLPDKIRSIFGERNRNIYGNCVKFDPIGGNTIGNVKKCAVGKHPKSEKLGGAGQAAVCACAHSRYFTGGSPSGLRV